MKKLQTLTLLIVLVMVLILGISESNSFATNSIPAPENLILSASEIRPFSDDGWGVGANDPNFPEDGLKNHEYAYNLQPGAVWGEGYHTIFKIGEFRNSENLDYRRALYCARFAVEFGTERPDHGGYFYVPQNYSKVGNMNSEVSEIIGFYERTMGNAEIDNSYTITGDRDQHAFIPDGESYTFTPYNALLWLVDNMAQIKGDANYEMTDADLEQINLLLAKAGLGNLLDSQLTIDDIDVVQQLAVWYFTNYDEGFNTLSIWSCLKITHDRENLDSKSYFALSNIYGGNSNLQRGKNIETLFNYLTENAMMNAEKYGTGNERPHGLENVNPPTVTLTEPNSVETVTISGTQYDVVGPMNLTVTGNNLTYFSNVGFSASINGTQIATNENTNGCYIVKKEGNSYSILNPNNIVMENNVFYFARPHTNEVINAFGMNISYTYSKDYRTATLYQNDTTDGGQPVIYTENKTVSDSGEVSISFNNERPDFALRKYITQVNGQNVTLSREPRLNEEDLAKINVNGTADYRHRKDAVEVMPGDTVTYTITVYNEGNVPGKVTKILDRLPNGIDVDIDATNALAVQEGKNYTATKVGNDVEITIKERAELPAFNGTTLSNYSVKVVCKVSEELAQTEEDQEFTNIAQITAFTVNGTPMTADIDSQVNENGYNNKPLAGYWGKDGQTETRPGASKPTNYYEGLQDDDDFEKLVIPGTTLKPDFALRKYITAVDGVALPNADKRVPKIDVSNLQTAGTRASTTTAEYKHRKDAVEVRIGGTVEYTIAVYNEGDVEGRVTKIVDRLPAGLKLNSEKTEALYNDKYTCTENRNGDIVITITDTTKLAPFTSGLEEPNKIEVKVVCDVLQVEGMDLSKDIVLTNIAQITEYEVNGTVVNNEAGLSDLIKDRDSQVAGEGYNSSALTAEYIGNSSNANLDASNPESYFEGMQDDDDFEKVFIRGVNADFALRKYITAINENTLTGNASRVPNVEMTHLKPTKHLNDELTAYYKHLKVPVIVKDGDLVTYTITVYNEGSAKGKVTQIIDHLPTGIVFVPELNKDFIAVKENGTGRDYAGYKYSYQLLDNKLMINLLENYELQPVTETSRTLDSKSIEVICKVDASQLSNLNEDHTLTNIAEISGYEAEGGVKDRDNKDRFNMPENLINYWGDEEANSGKDPKDKNNYFEGQEDDDDFEKVKLQGVRFDLALRKFITAVERDGQNIEIESRVPEIELAGLRNGTDTTAVYHHPKIDHPVVVKNGDIVTYTLRVYNEGDVDGYADLITDHLPDGTLLEFILNSTINTKYGWELSEDLSTISTKYWERGQTPYGEKVDGKVLAYDREMTKENVPENEYWQQAMDGNDGLYYRDVQIQFKVVAPNNYQGSIINIAEIADSTPVGPGGDPIDVPDPDSPNPVDPSNPGGPGGYPLDPDPSEGQEDDDDYEIIQLKYFDLALRKFITGVNNETITSRIPEAVWNEETGKIQYRHGKDPVVVSNGDIVTYTIRVYNEGSIAGFAEEVADDIPVGLVYLPEHPTNIYYRWQLADENGTARVVTDYLSEAHGETMKENAGDENPNLIAPFDFESPISNVRPYNPDFRDVKIAFQVDQSALEDPETVVVNHAQITDDSDDDDDSTPDEWNDGDDDQDIEKIRVRIFDLSLQKWVTHTIVTVDGETTVVETGFMPNVGHTDQTGRPNSENEPLAQVVIDKKKLDRTEIKFIYAIKVSNEGEIPGYATEITDYIPEGLMFVEADNPLWTKVGDDKVVTHALETELLNPGDSRILEIVFTWINNENNLGVKRNIAAITGDYNEAGDTPDRDSTPGNTNTGKYEGEQEDDDDFALVILSLKTGGEKTYIAVALVALAIIATGAFFIKRFVLE